MKILIVDDKEENRYMLESLLKGSGYEVFTAINGVEALLKLKKDSIEIIISDIMMPKMDGFQLCRECKSDDSLKKIPFIFYTATYTSEKDEKFALSLGAEKFIVKPMEPDLFMEELEGIIRDYNMGNLIVSEIQVKEDDPSYIKEYTARLTNKLEDQMREKDEINRVLKERVKELTCLRLISEFIENQEISLQEILKGTVEVIPDAWQYPEIACARIIMEDREFKTGNFRETVWKQVKDFSVQGKKSGTVEVYYLKEQPESDEGPFLKEERTLLDIIAARLAISITRINMEEALKLSSLATETSISAVITADLKGIITYANLAAAKMWGYKSAKKMIGTNVMDYWTKLTRGFASEMIETILKEGSSCSSGSLRGIKLDGTEFILETYCVLAKDVDGKPIGMIGSFSDITGRKKTEEEKEVLQNQLFHSQKMESLGTLTGGIAHDFNNILTAIIGDTDLLLSEAKPGDKLKDDLLNIRSSSLRAAELVKQLLLFSRKQPVNMKTEDINELLNDMAKMLFRLLGENISIQMDLSDKEPCFIKADKGNINQVLMNLAVNARDAMPDGGKLTIASKKCVLNKEDVKVLDNIKPGSYIKITVQDTGSGIPKEIQKTIFEPFFTTKAEGKGTGLGLSVVFGIIKVHNGTINVYSEPNHGTCFSIYFPIIKESKSKHGKVNKTKLDYKGNGERILVVEDEESIQNVTKKMLKIKNYRPFLAKTLKEAIEIYKKEKGDFALVFSDMILPDGTGLEVLVELNKIKPIKKALLSSGYLDDKSKWEELSQKGIPFIQKPYGMNELAEKIAEVLS
jgi:PAS domain S-box-containing protein